MGDHDAASVVGQMAGLGDEPKPAPVPPSALIASFCSDRDANYIGGSASTRTEDDGTIISSGFCGYNGRRDTADSLLTGFDDGYDFMGYLNARGWRSLAAKGDWPYVVYLRWPASEGERETIVEYCEADFTAWQFPDHDAAKALYVSLRDAP